MDAVLVLMTAFLIVQIAAVSVLLAYRKNRTEKIETICAYFDVGIRARATAVGPTLALAAYWLIAFSLSDGDLHEDLGSPICLLGISLLAVEIPAVILYIPSIRRL